MEQIKTRIVQAREAGCQLLILPELVLSGSPPLDLLRRPSFLEAHDRVFARLLADTRDIAVLCGLISRDISADGKALYNSAILFEETKVKFVIHRYFLEDCGGFRQSPHFTRGEICLPVPFRGLRLGISIGEELLPRHNCSSRDIYSPHADIHHGGGADLFINLAATPFIKGGVESRLDQLSGISGKYRTPLLYVNQLGGQDSLLFDGQCLALNKEGRLSRSTPPFEGGMLVVDSERLDPADEQEKENGSQDLHHILRGIVTGIRDYVHKSGFSRVIIGLSGGIDSALTCAAACRALGPENVLGVALPSAISSPGSIADARQLAENFGIRFEIIPIKEAFQVMKAGLEPLFQGYREDVTEANLQARIRGTFLMALANKFNRLLLATGNKSEVAAGYCTLYGDTCGALAPLADIPKTMVYQLAGLINRESGPEQKGAIPESSLAKAPSAELIPGQKDQDDLPDYGTMDAIIQYWLEERLSVAEIINKGYDSLLVKDLIRRLEKNEYKRHQLPPGLRITSRAFDLGTGRPITAGYWQKYD